MHVQSDDERRYFLERMPELYTWTACRLTRNLMEECWSDEMQKALERFARNHMEGSKAYQITCGGPGRTVLTLRKHTTPPPGFTDMETFLKRMDKGAWTTDDDKPAREVEIHSVIQAEGDSPWVMNQAKLSLDNPPASIVTRLIAGKAALPEIIGGPWTKGYSIHSVWWRGEHWKDGKKLDHNAAAEMNGHIEIMLDGANDFQKIRIRR